jgi:acetyl-CoA decarbonylase/synthase complex subunit gamma
MALSGLEIYKLLPQTNCKECGFPTCLAFAMKLAAKQVELKDCPYVSEESKIKLEAASAPPIRLIKVAGTNGKLQVGNETVLYRHEKTFYHKPGIFWRLQDSENADDLKKKASTAEAYHVDYVGIDLRLDGFAIDATSDEPTTFAGAVEAVRSVSEKPFILITSNPEVAKAGIEASGDTLPLLYAADSENWEDMAGIAKEANVPLAVRGETLEELADLTKKLTDAGLEDLVIDPSVTGYLDSLTKLTAIRRLALKENFRPLGFPIITFPGLSGDADQTLLAAEHISKYAGFVVLENFEPASLYPLMVLRENIYTDPQKPIQVQPGIYELNGPDANSPLLVTTNFSITYFSVANEVEGSGWPAWLMVADAEGMSVLTAWAAGKFDAERIAKSVKTFNAEEKVTHKKIIIPGLVAVISGELEEELPGWEIMVGPRESVDIASYLKAMWQN